MTDLIGSTVTVKRASHWGGVWSYVEEYRAIVRGVIATDTPRLLLEVRSQGKDNGILRSLDVMCEPVFTDATIVFVGWEK